MNFNGRPQKAAMLVAQRIVRDISRQGLQPGERLPPERAMLEQYQIGRGTLREALRLLEFQGVIALKPGPKGGPVLLDPSPTHLADSLMLLMQLVGVPFRSVVEMRLTLEPAASRMAAARMSDDDLRRLEGNVADMASHIHDEYAFFDLNKEFHDIVAAASGNVLLRYVTESLSGIMDGTVLGVDYPAARRNAVLRAHRKILQALQARNADDAEQLMKEHIDAFVRFSEKRYPDLLDNIVHWGNGSAG